MGTSAQTGGSSHARVTIVCKGSATSYAITVTRLDAGIASNTAAAVIDVGLATQLAAAVCGTRCSIRRAPDACAAVIDIRITTLNEVTVAWLNARGSRDAGATAVTVGRTVENTIAISTGTRVAPAYATTIDLRSSAWNAVTVAL